MPRRVGVDSSVIDDRTRALTDVVATVVAKVIITVVVVTRLRYVTGER